MSDDPKPPAHIYLLDYGSTECTWCEDPDPSGEDHSPVGYVRADALAAKDAEIARIKDENEHFVKISKNYHDLLQADIDRLKAMLNEAEHVCERVAMHDPDTPGLSYDDPLQLVRSCVASVRPFLAKLKGDDHASD